VTFDPFSLSEVGHCTLGPPNYLGVPHEILGITATTGVSPQRYASGACGMCLKVSRPFDKGPRGQDSRGGGAWAPCPDLNTGAEYLMVTGIAGEPVQRMGGLRLCQ
jgi:hypothetical protein